MGDNETDGMFFSGQLEYVILQTNLSLSDSRIYLVPLTIILSYDKQLLLFNKKKKFLKNNQQSAISYSWFVCPGTCLL